MKFYELPPSMCGSELLNHQSYWRNTYGNTQKYPQYFSSPNVASPNVATQILSLLEKPESKKIHDSFH